MKPSQRISILGAGWLGFPLAQHLLQQDFEVKTSTTSPEKLEFLAQAGLNPVLLRVDNGLVECSDPAFFDTDVIFVNVPPSRRRPDVRTWYPTQVRAILEQARAAAVQRVLFISSTSVYGDVNAEVDETATLRPDTPSAQALVEAENEVKQSFPADQSSILRMSGLVGGDRKAGRFFAGKHEVPEGNAPVNLVYLEDCIGVISALLTQQAWGKVYNVCADGHPRKADYYTARAIAEGFDPPTFLVDEHPRFKIVNNARVKQELGYVFIRKIGLEE